MSDEQQYNPIDPDKVAENPSTLPYAHTVGGAVIRPDDLKKNRSRALTSMQQQTDMQLNQIKQQIELLAKQARAIEARKELSEMIYAAKIGFKPEINHTYHLYRKDDDSFVLSMIAPEEWGRSSAPGKFVHSIILLADHTWEIVER